MKRQFKPNLLTVMIVVALIALVSVVVAGCTSGAQVKPTPTAAATPIIQTTKTVIDQLGRNVTIPYNVTKVISVGAVPPINSFIQAMGEGNTIADGIPPGFNKAQWIYQFNITPQLANLPSIQSSETSPNNEAILQVDPQVILTTTDSLVSGLQSTGIPVVYVQATCSTDLENYMTVLGEVYNEPARAQEYNNYLNNTLNYVNNTVGSIPMSQRPTVLYMSDPETLQVPNAICPQWISAAGGICVSASAQGNQSSYQFDMEQLLAWNPDIIILRNPDLMGYFYNTSEFSSLTAVKNHQIYSTPAGVQIWAGGTPEYPLMVEWAAKLFYPDKFQDLNMTSQTISYYQEFFNWSITPQTAQNILNGQLLLNS